MICEMQNVRISNRSTFFSPFPAFNIFLFCEHTTGKEKGNPDPPVLHFPPVSCILLAFYEKTGNFIWKLF